MKSMARITRHKRIIELNTNTTRIGAIVWISNFDFKPSSKLSLMYQCSISIQNYAFMHFLNLSFGICQKSDKLSGLTLVRNFFYWDDLILLLHTSSLTLWWDESDEKTVSQWQLWFFRKRFKNWNSSAHCKYNMNGSLLPGKLNQGIAIFNNEFL